MAGVNPVAIRAHYGAGFHHPHLQTGTAGDWPLNVFDEEQAAAELPTLRAMASPTSTTSYSSSGGTGASFRQR